MQGGCHLFGKTWCIHAWNWRSGLEICYHVGKRKVASRIPLFIRKGKPLYSQIYKAPSKAKSLDSESRNQTTGHWALVNHRQMTQGWRALHSKLTDLNSEDRDWTQFPSCFLFPWPLPSTLNFYFSPFYSQTHTGSISLHHLKKIKCYAFIGF